MKYKKNNIVLLTSFVFLIIIMVRTSCKVKKIVVFDFDETLGHFSELGYFCEGLERYFNTILDDKDMFILLDIYPEFLRPSILPILNYLKIQKKGGNCDKIMVYTNNQAPKYWVETIIRYFEKKLNSNNLFDRIISAFKIGNEHIELGRTSHAKTINDFYNCTKLPKNSEICFIDDQYHPEMAGDNVYYIYIKPYKYTLYSDEMIDRFFNSYLSKNINDKDDFRKFMTNFMKGYKYEDKSEEDYEIDRIVSKKIIENLQHFFSNTQLNKTIKKR